MIKTITQLSAFEGEEERKVTQMIKVGSRSLLAGIEQQIDFMCKKYGFRIDGSRAVPKMNRLLDSEAYAISSIDWHFLEPVPHVSFEKWGIHCVPNTVGARYHPKLKSERIMVEFRKGTRPDEDIYDSCDVPNFLPFIRMLDPDIVIVNGSAVPVCPSMTAITLAKEFEVYLAWDACCFINGMTRKDRYGARKVLEDAGVRVVKTKDFKL